MRIEIPSKYLKTTDLQGRRPNVQIDRVTYEDVDGDMRYILYFIGKAKGLILNVTNTRTLLDALGDESDHWQGATLELFAIDTEFQGRATKGLRLRLVDAEPQQQQQRPQQQQQQQAAPNQATGNHQAIDEDEIPF
jgi:hypothetical protein